MNGIEGLLPGSEEIPTHRASALVDDVAEAIRAEHDRLAGVEVPVLHLGWGVTERERVAYGVTDDRRGRILPTVDSGPPRFGSMT